VTEIVLDDPVSMDRVISAWLRRKAADIAVVIDGVAAGLPPEPEWEPLEIEEDVALPEAVDDGFGEM
jgi:hypothetical protein